MRDSVGGYVQYDTMRDSIESSAPCKLVACLPTKQATKRKMRVVLPRQ